MLDLDRIQSALRRGPPHLDDMKAMIAECRAARRLIAAQRAWRALERIDHPIAGQQRLLDDLCDAESAYAALIQEHTEGVSPMRPRPQPRELVIRMDSMGAGIHIWASSDDARTWIEREGPPFGHLHPPSSFFPAYTLHVTPAYDLGEVADYLNSYNEDHNAQP